MNAGGFGASMNAGTVSAEGKKFSGDFPKRRGGGPQHGSRRGGNREDGFRRARPELDQKIISIRRVTRVVAGGRRFGFSVAIVSGNRNGQVGVGLGKAGNTALAIEKATRDAKRNMIVVPLTDDKSIAHEVQVKFASSDIILIPAKGRGLVAGSSVRTVLDLAGVTDTTAKIFSRSKNKLNNAFAALRALEMLSIPKKKKKNDHGEAKKSEKAKSSDEKDVKETRHEPSI
ncbi:30S ribosomal protein S5 [bacterium]|nr:30S ribosomal protein S5 [bacterium]